MVMRLLVLTFFLLLSISLHATRNSAPPDRYIAGGVMGTVVGLGVGQAINGNYGTTGWVFSTFEGVLGVGPMVAGLVLGYQVIKSIIPSATPGYFLSLRWISDLQKDKVEVSMAALDSEEGQSAVFKKALVGGGLLGFGILMFTAFRIWDIVDVWRTPIGYGSQKSQALFVLPYLDTEVTGVSLRF